MRDELMAEWAESLSTNPSHNQQGEPTDMTLSTRNFSSPPGIRGPRHLTSSVQDLHAKTSTSHTHGSSPKAYHHHHQQQEAHSSHLHHHGHRGGVEGSPLSPPPPVPSQSPVPRSPTMTTATFMLATSPPPVSQQSVWMTRSQPHHHVQPAPHRHNNVQHQNVTGVAPPSSIHHSDSGEWTEFTSAPYSSIGGGQDSTSMLALPSRSTFSDGFPASHSTPALSALINSGGSADVSEFDPIAVSSSGVGTPSELHQAQPPFKQRT